MKEKCLRNAKIVYSIYGDDFKVPFRNDFGKKLQMDGIAENDLRSIKEDASFVSLAKLAIDFSDGVIQGSESINPEISKYIGSNKQIPFLPFQSPETYLDAFNSFYD